eukprot:5305879-Prymnesium_polylepis.3
MGMIDAVGIVPVSDHTTRVRVMSGDVARTVGAHTSRCAEICTRSQVHTQLLRARADRGYVDTVDRKTAQSRTHIRRASR